MLLCQDGATPLILAAQMSRVELCVFLLGRGASVNIQDNEGRYWTQSFIPPLLMVKQQGQKIVLCTSLKAVSDGITPFMCR